MKGFGAGMVKVPAIITPALRDATGPLSIGQAARLLNLGAGQVYGWFERGLPVVRLRQGRGNDKVRVDAAALREWLKENQPTVWIQADEDGLLCTRSEYLQRLGMCQNMKKRWRYEAYLRFIRHRTGRRRPDAGPVGARHYRRIGRAGDCHATA